MVIEQDSLFLVFLVEKKNRRVWENRMSRTSGKDGVVITNATRVCNVHFQQSDIVRVPGGSRLCLKLGTLPLKWNQRPAGEQEKRKAPKTEVNHLTSCTGQQTQGQFES